MAQPPSPRFLQQIIRPSKEISSSIPAYSHMQWLLNKLFEYGGFFHGQKYNPNPVDL